MSLFVTRSLDEYDNEAALMAQELYQVVLVLALC